MQQSYARYRFNFPSYRSTLYGSRIIEYQRDARLMKSVYWVRSVVLTRYERQLRYANLSLPNESEGEDNRNRPRSDPDVRVKILWSDREELHQERSMISNSDGKAWSSTFQATISSQYTALSSRKIYALTFRVVSRIEHRDSLPTPLVLRQWSDVPSHFTSCHPHQTRPRYIL